MDLRKQTDALAALPPTPLLSGGKPDISVETDLPSARHVLMTKSRFSGGGARRFKGQRVESDRGS